MKLLINTKPLTDSNAGRGVGQYTRMLIEAIKNFTNIELVEKEEMAEIVHYPFFDLFFLTLPFNKPKPTVVTVHDVIPLLYPHAYLKGVRGTIKQFIQMKSLASAKKIVTDSNCSTDDVVRLLKQPKEKVETVYIAPDPRYSPASRSLIESVKNKYDLSKPYFLYVGDINYNKNLTGLIKTFTEINEDSLLVFVSKSLRRNNSAAHSIWQAIDSLGVEKRLRILNDIPLNPLDEMRAIYSGALWYVQPSIYEGFGLPVLEAQACECPVISTNEGSLKEIANGSCLEFNFFKSAFDTDRNQFIKLGIRNCDRFSWKKTAENMKEIYEKIL